ncbi:hypothetical protein BDM02DRAFT_3264335 [Thelephora ganbajun]|uniref:Uncharacterized protein n=1 Tax=Thelephora ganbajun TaxID=370292 RepID=A0ACB6Z0J4_THEGA|nr:hypothetical protein BDM02DRAFT_3264335 [Thelephora ganbajun]
MLAGPVSLGRRFFLLFAAQEVHDRYSFVVGFHLLWGCWLVTQAIECLDRHRQRRENGSRAWWSLFLSKRSSLWLAQASHVAFFLVSVIPTLMGLVMEIYVLLSIKLIYDPNLVVKVKLVEMRVLDLVLCDLDSKLRNAWSRPDPVTATKEIIGPVVGGLLVMLAFPVGMLWIFKLLINYRITDRALFVSIYPGVFTGVGVVRGILGLRNAYLKWSQTVRDKEFLVEMWLRNLEPEENIAVLDIDLPDQLCVE